VARDNVATEEKMRTSDGDDDRGSDADDQLREMNGCIEAVSELAVSSVQEVRFGVAGNRSLRIGDGEGNSQDSRLFAQPSPLHPNKAGLKFLWKTVARMASHGSSDWAWMLKLVPLCHRHSPSCFDDLWPSLTLFSTQISREQEHECRHEHESEIIMIILTTAMVSSHGTISSSLPC
jgi:hypothetical protein